MKITKRHLRRLISEIFANTPTGMAASRVADRTRAAQDPDELMTHDAVAKLSRLGGTEETELSSIELAKELGSLEPDAPMKISGDIKYMPVQDEDFRSTPTAAKKTKIGLAAEQITDHVYPPEDAKLQLDLLKKLEEEGFVTETFDRSLPSYYSNQKYWTLRQFEESIAMVWNEGIDYSIDYETSGEKQIWTIRLLKPMYMTSLKI